MIKVYTANTGILNDDALFSSLYSRISEDRQKTIQRLKFRKDRNLSLGVEILLIHALENENIDTQDLVFSTVQNGKPCLVNRDIQFNLSHSGNISMCAISDKEIGCDVEKIEKRGRDILRIAKNFFFDNEYRYISDLEDEDERIDMFFRLWTLKESFMKVTGLGMALPLKDFSIEINDSGIYVSHSLNDKIYYEKELHLDNEYKYAVCSLCDDSPVCIKTDLETI